MIGLIVMPGSFVSTRNCVSPSCFFAGSWLVRNVAIM